MDYELIIALFIAVLLVVLFIVVVRSIGQYTLNIAIKRRERKRFTRDGKAYGVRIVEKKR